MCEISDLLSALYYVVVCFDLGLCCGTEVSKLLFTIECLVYVSSFEEMNVVIRQKAYK